MQSIANVDPPGGRCRGVRRPPGALHDSSKYSNSPSRGIRDDAFARRTDLSIDTIRYYRPWGCCTPRARRASGGVRRHAPATPRAHQESQRPRPVAEGYRRSARHPRPRQRPGVAGGAGAESPPRTMPRQVATRLDIPAPCWPRSNARPRRQRNRRPGRGRVYTDADLEVGKGAIKLLRLRFRSPSCWRWPEAHRAVRKTVDAAIDLFDAHVAKASPKGRTIPRRWPRRSATCCRW